MRFLRTNGELMDAAILRAIDGAKKDYEDGAIAEAAATLQEIVNAIDQFGKIWEEQNT